MTERDRLLRDINKNSDVINNYNKLMCTLTIAVLTCGLSANEPIILITPCALITDIYYIVQSIERKNCQISAYIITFLEKNCSPQNDSIKWETRLYEYDHVLYIKRKNARKKKNDVV